MISAAQTKSVAQDLQVLGERNPRASDMPTEKPLAVHAVASRDRVEQQPMFGVDDPTPLSTIVHHEGAPEVLSRIP